MPIFRNQDASFVRTACSSVRIGFCTTVDGQGWTAQGRWSSAIVEALHWHVFSDWSPTRRYTLLCGPFRCT
jgi:hypothetical protein